MRVFITGASGWIGSKIVSELLSTGHTVLGLARSDESAKALTAAGADVHRGSLEDLDSLRSGAAAAADGVIHCGMTHDFSDMAKMCATDRAAIEAMGTVLAGTNKPFIISAGTALLPYDRLVTEKDAYDHSGFKVHRGPSETLALSFAAKGVRVALIRLPPTVHGEGDKGFVANIIGIAKAKGVSAYVGDGANVWPAVHRVDAAHVYCLALEKAPAGSIFHAVQDQGVPMKEIATIIGKHLSVPVVSKTPEEANAHFGWVAGFLQVNNPTSSAITQQQLGWKPTQPTLLEDLDQEYYYQNSSKYAH